MAGISLGDFPSWLTVVVIGIGVWWGYSNGMLDSSYKFGESLIMTEGLGSILVVIGLGLGAFYFIKDISNKL
jgi:hypothetical protein